MEHLSPEREIEKDFEDLIRREFGRSALESKIETPFGLSLMTPMEISDQKHRRDEKPKTPVTTYCARVVNMKMIKYADDTEYR